MQNINYKIILFVSLLSLASAAYGDYRESWLDHGPSVAAFGRGETAVSIFDDFSSVFYNPSLQSYLTCKTATLSYYPLFDGSMYSYAGFGMPLSHGYSLGLSLINLRSGDVELRQNINDIPTTTNTNQYAGLLSFAKVLEKPFQLNIGLDLRFVYYNLDGYTGSGVGADAGISRNFDGPSIFGNKSTIDVGFSAQNVVSPSVTLISEAETYPVIYRLGGALKVPTVYHSFSFDQLLLAVDMISEENCTSANAGVEYSFSNRFIFKSGYYDGHITIGAGYHVAKLHVDYAYDLGDMANMNRFGVSYFFAGGGAKATEDKKYSLAKEAKLSLAEEKKRRKEFKVLLKQAIVYYDNGFYLKATDLLKDIMLKYPEYETAGIYLNKIETEMNSTIQNNDPDIEKFSYASGYSNYQKLAYNEALNEWEKVLQMNPKREELTEYVQKVKSYLSDADRIKREKELADQTKKLFDNGVNAFNSSRWVSCVKSMERVKDLCAKNTFPESFEYSSKASDYIAKSVEQLSKTIKTGEAKEATPAETDIDEAGAEKHYQEGLLLYAQGKQFDAEKEWDLALRLNPNHVKAQKALIKLKEEK